jgi:hypothetical protein
MLRKLAAAVLMCAVAVTSFLPTTASAWYKYPKPPIVIPPKPPVVIPEHVLKSAGRKPYKAITRATIVSGRDRRAGTPAQARHFIEALRVSLHGR